MPSAKTVIREATKFPLRVLKATIQRAFRRNKSRPRLFLFGFNDWKIPYFQDRFPDYEIVRVPMTMWPIDFHINWKWKLWEDPRNRALQWQYKAPDDVVRFCRKRGIEFHYVEDGFIRSVNLGAKRTPALSLAFDESAMYFDSRQPSDLEKLLSTYDFDADKSLMSRASAAMQTLLTTGLSKYNSSSDADVAGIYGEKTRKRILVVGQVERDASIKFGCDKRLQNNDIVWLARLENPEAQIIYKPHPEVMQGTAEAESDPTLVSGAAQILTDDISLADAFQTIDHVYTISSLAGFEALMRGIKVTTLGCPFYSGWGLTDDRQPNARRTRRLTVEQVFAGAYILYPSYFDFVRKEQIEIEQATELLQGMKANQPIVVPETEAPHEEVVDALSLAIADSVKNALLKRKVGDFLKA